MLAAIAKTEISSSDPAFFRKIMKELLYDACEPETVDDLIPTDMSVGGSPDRRDKAKCWDYNHGLCSKGVPGGNCGPTANKKHHLCDMKVNQIFALLKLLLICFYRLDDGRTAVQQKAQAH